MKRPQSARREETRSRKRSRCQGRVCLSVLEEEEEEVRERRTARRESAGVLKMN
jgi:hypothetical protein